MITFEWFFDGIGSTLIGILIGGSVGYKIGVKKSIKQKQRAGKNSNQVQIGKINDR